MMECQASTRLLAFVLEMAASTHPGYKDFVWAVELNRFGMHLIGLWPKVDEEGKSAYASDLRVGIVFVTLNFLSLVPLIWSLIRVWGDMILMIDNLQVTLSLVLFTMKLAIIRWKRAAIATIVKMMVEDWMELNLDSDRIVMLRRAQIARQFTIFGYTLMGLGFLVIIILPSFGLPYRHVTNITDRDRPLPLQAYYFYDTDKSPLFELTFIVQAVTIMLGTVTYTSVDAFLGIAILHICGQLENYRRKLVNLITCKNFESALRDNVETHRRLIRFGNNIEDAFCLLLLGLVFYFGVVFCLCTFIFLAVFTGNEDVTLSRKCVGIIGAITLFAHTFLYCGAGELITEECDAVYSALYDIDWYKLEPRRTRLLMLLMMRAKQPLRITAGRVIPLTMTTFCSLLKSSAGYISFLLAMRN